MAEIRRRTRHKEREETVGYRFGRVVRRTACEGQGLVGGMHRWCGGVQGACGDQRYT